MSIAKAKVSTRLALGFGTILLLLVFIIGFGIYGMSHIQAHLQKIVHENQYKTSLLQTMVESVHTVARVTHTMVLLDDNALIQEETKKIIDARKAYDDANTALEKLPASDAGRALRAQMREAQEAVRPLNNEVMRLASEHQDAEATKMLMEKAAPANNKWLAALSANMELQEKSNALATEDAENAYRQSNALMLALGFVAILIGIAATVLIMRSLLKQLGGEPGYAAEVAGRIAAGDLTLDIQTRPADRSSLMYAMKEMNNSLVRIVSQVRHGTETIATGSAQIATGNTDLSSRTEEQASSLEETASSMEELTSTVKQNADNAREASSLATSASEIAGQGGVVVEQVVETMGAIHDSSRKIVEIISVIDSIAFQTNILALNAAVEAARAGEQGRGFAVVASEVRTLAQRSANAAKEIKELINDSVGKVDTGSRLVEEAGATMREVVGSVRRVADLIGDITAAGAEQTAGIEQVNEAIAQMDQVTQQNAALVEEAAAAAQSMQDQSRELAAIVSIFKLKDSEAYPATATKTLRAVQPAAIGTRTGKPAALSSSAKKTAGPALALSQKGDDWEEF